MGLNPLLNSVEQYSSTNAGTGSITLGTLVSPNALTFAQAGAIDGQPYTFRLDANNGDFEIVRCTSSSTGTIISRDTVIISVIGGVVGTSKITVTTQTQCRVVQACEDSITRQQSLSRGWLIGG